jgi:hypothetical protein
VRRRRGGDRQTRAIAADWIDSQPALSEHILPFGRTTERLELQTSKLREKRLK